MTHILIFSRVAIALATLTGVSASNAGDIEWQKPKSKSSLVLKADNVTRTAFVERYESFRTHDGYQIRGKFSYPRPTGSNVVKALDGSQKLMRHMGVLLLHGSGNTDMNLWIPGRATATGQPTKLFQDIADALNEGGAVVYRYNKRGVYDTEAGAPSVDEAIAKTRSVTNLLRDAKTALEVLRRDPRVDPNRIVLLGLSEGTTLAPLIATSDQNISGLVLMSSMGRNLRDTLTFQFVERHMNLARYTLDANRDGLLTEAEIAAYPDVHIDLRSGDHSQDGKLSIAEFEALLLAQYYSVLDSMRSGPESSWVEEHFALPPNYKNIAAYNGKILLFHGELDAQTPFSDAILISQTLKDAKRTNFELVSFPGVGHGFSPPKGVGNVVPTVGPIQSSVLERLKHVPENF